MQKALDAFHAARPNARLELRVSRRPYSWAGDDRSVDQGLVRYGGSDYKAEKGYEEGPRATPTVERKPMAELGAVASIEFDTAKEMKWQPVDSQRLILWAGRFGKQEEYAEALSSRHFERRESNALRSTVLAAAADVGLDTVAAAAHLDTEDGVEAVWESYGNMIRRFGITEIPVFCFHRRGAASPFDQGYEEDITPTPYIIVGSASIDIFSTVFGHLYDEEIEGAAADAALGEKYIGKTVALQDGRHGVVRAVQPGGALIIEAEGDQEQTPHYVRLPTRAPEPPRGGGGAAPGPRAVAAAAAGARL